MSLRQDPLVTPVEAWALATIAGACAMGGPAWGLTVSVVFLLAFVAYRKLSGG